MTGFEEVRFHGSFRDYQQRVIDSADKYLKDGKINIVAAPGSGKTVLGLELICRIGSPCIILSPTTAIRQQWGDRLKELFLEDKNHFGEVFSDNLHKVKLFNSITYQALYTAIEKVQTGDEGEDCSDIDIFKTISDAGIKTVCLDEAHHLKNEWQKALEKFISSLGKDVKIISLTATPPYDSDETEWNRYINVCGEIDEEIFVPELVGQNTLCPHQDYVYFNYPTDAETAAFQEHKNNVIIAIAELKTLELFAEVYKTLNVESDYEKLFANAKEYIALCTLLSHYGFEINKKLISELTAKRGLPRFNAGYAEVAVEFLLVGEMISEEQKEQIIAIIRRNGVYEKHSVTFSLNEKLKRSLISSVGKLDSIKKIVKSEISSMGSGLRMLILTDYIKKENLCKIATQENFNSVNVVSIFETLRRDNPEENIGVLSGGLVILPQSVDLSGIKHKKEDIQGTKYCAVEFYGSTNGFISFVSKLFERGEINILVGTKSLLGEGWDSPCINSLILASFVGSFVLSNQMRGRAIRIDKNNPDKSSNIWHLVTIEPEYLFKDKLTERVSEYMNRDENTITSCDYDVLKRRFDSFIGPNYTTGVIESGIERLTAIKPPFNRAGIQKINSKMLELSQNRAEVKSKWQGEVADGKFEVGVETKVPSEKRVPIFTFWNIGLVVLLAVAEMAAIYPLYSQIARSNLYAVVWIILIICAVGVAISYVSKRLIMHFNPARSIKTLGRAVYKTLRECDLISSSAKMETIEDKQLVFVSLYLRNASVHDQNIFNTAMAEMLSPIENPRYILIAKKKTGGYNYELSFSCPSVIGKKKEYAAVLAEKLKEGTGNFEPVYTRNEDGRKLILKCRKNAYITFNQKAMDKKYKVSHWE